MACIDFAQGVIGPVAPVFEATTLVNREKLFDCEYFRVWRLRGESPFTVGAADLPRVLVCIEGAGQVEHGHDTYDIRKGDVFLLPAALGACAFRPGEAVTLLEIALPDCHSQNSRSEAL
jgi:mannose-6-phosphate isomerase